jgi:hypothetical protein
METILIGANGLMGTFVPLKEMRRRWQRCFRPSRQPSCGILRTAAGVRAAQVPEGTARQKTYEPKTTS